MYLEPILLFDFDRKVSMILLRRNSLEMTSMKWIRIEKSS